MKISASILKKYVNLPSSMEEIEKIFETFTTRTSEINEIFSLKSAYDNMVLGKILELSKHPNADKLKIVKLDIGSQTIQLVCGGTNLYEGQLVAAALPGAKVRWHGEGDLITLEKAKIRGEESFGMICAANEIGIKNRDADGVILDLSHLKTNPGTPLAEALEKDDVIIDVDNKGITHRPDLWSHYGVAREVAAITNENFKKVNPQPNLKKKKLPPLNIKIQDEVLCPRYMAVKIDNIKVEASPSWLKNALENLGHRSINNIVDATNLVMLELGNPLHAFDLNKISEEAIVVRKAQSNEKIVTLDGEERKLNDSMLIIADSRKPIALAGIMGGLESGINNDTTSIILESANFNPISIRKTSKQFNLRSDASARYEKSLDPNLAELALLRFLELLQELCPNMEISSEIFDHNKNPFEEITLDLNLARASSKIGVQIDNETAKELLERIEFKIGKSSKKGHVKVTVPSFRATRDINIEDDLVEELARLYGYENIPTVVPQLTATLPIINPERKLKYQLRNVLSYGLKFNEVSNYSFYSLKTLQNSNLDENLHLKVKNYLSEEQTHLRVSLIPNLLHNIHHNLKNFSNFKLYEFGHTFIQHGDFFPIEHKNLAGAIVLDKKSKTDPFMEAKTAAESVLKELNINSLQFQRATTQNNFAHPAKHAEYIERKSGLPIIQIYFLHPAIATNFDISNSQIAIFEINYSHLVTLPMPPKIYSEISKFPAIEIDISTLIDKNTEIGSMINSIKCANPNLIKSVKLTDLYQGSNIPENKKSALFKITLQSADKTLTDQEMRESQEAIFKNLKDQGAEIRGF